MFEDVGNCLAHLVVFYLGKDTFSVNPLERSAFVSTYWRGYVRRVSLLNEYNFLSVELIRVVFVIQMGMITCRYRLVAAQKPTVVAVEKFSTATTVRSQPFVFSHKKSTVVTVRP